MSSGHASLKCRSGNRKFWAEACRVSAVGLNGAAIVECIRQGQTGICLDRPSVREYEDSSRNQPGGLSGGHAAGQGASGSNEAKAKGPGSLAFASWGCVLRTDDLLCGPP